MNPERDWRGKTQPASNARRVAAFGDANRQGVEDHVRRYQNSGVAPSSVSNRITALRHLEDFFEGRPFEELRSRDLELFVEHLRAAIPSPSTVHLTSIQVRAFLRDLHGVERMAPHMEKAIHVRKPPYKPKGQLVMDADFEAILEVAGGLGKKYGTLPTADKSLALVWTLWDSGFRIEEMLALDVGDIEFEDQDGARLRLQEDLDGLKTGARSVYVVECVGVLRAWLDMHPAGMDASAPLFNAWLDRTGYKRMQYDGAKDHIGMLGEKSGVNQRRGKRRGLCPHDFRHTCATRKAKQGWMESELRKYFGWSLTSPMPSHYVHLSLADMRERVRRDAGIDKHGRRQAAKDVGEGPDLKAMLRKLLMDDS